MINLNIVVDTNIVDFAFLDEDPGLNDSCYKSIYSILEKPELFWVIDSPMEGSIGNRILIEYMKKLACVRDFEVFWMKLNESEKVKYVIPIVDLKISEKLNEMKMQEEDRVFVFTAIAADKFLISEDGDFGVSKGKEEYKERYKYFTENLGMKIMNSSSFLDYLMKI